MVLNFYNGSIQSIFARKPLPRQHFLVGELGVYASFCPFCTPSRVGNNLFGFTNMACPDRIFCCHWPSVLCLCPTLQSRLISYLHGKNLGQAAHAHQLSTANGGLGSYQSYVSGTPRCGDHDSPFTLKSIPYQ